MPELPEVEAARRAIEEHCVGKRIQKAVVADDPKVVDGVPHAEFEAALTGKTILAALRKGKNLWLRLDSPPHPSFQFGMAGAIYIKGVAVTKYKRSAVNSTDEWPSKYSKVFIHLDDGLELSFTDKRRFARVRILKDPASVPPISELGPDALLEPMSLDEFVDSLKNKKTAIKALLLDQSYISGIGNWVADEVLYQSRVHPLQIAANLSRESCESLRSCIKEVIHFAVEVDADCSRFPVEWLFHFRWGKKSGKVNGKTIEFITAGGRTSAYVPELQKLTGTQSGKAPPRKPRKTKSNTKADEEESGGEEDMNDESESEETGHTGEHKPKRGKNSVEEVKQPLKKLTGVNKPRKTRSATKAGKEESGSKDDNEGSDGGDEGHTNENKSKRGKNAAAGEVKKAPTKKITSASHGDDDEGRPKKTVKVTVKEQMGAKEESSKKRAEASRSSGQQKKKARR